MPLVFLVLWHIPGAAAHDTAPFPNIMYQDFNRLVAEHFHPDVPLAAVLGFLFSVLRNPDLLSLHYRMKYKFEEQDTRNPQSNWGTFLAESMLQKWDPVDLGQNTSKFVAGSFGSGNPSVLKSHKLLTAVEALITLTCFATNRRDKDKSYIRLPHIDEQSIQHLTMLVPPYTQCRSGSCRLAIHRHSRD